LKNKDGLMAVLERHGIKNPSEFLKEKGDTAKIVASMTPDVRIRGSIHLMKKQKISRRELNDGFAKLKYL
jgi:hypothetical protein